MNRAKYPSSHTPRGSYDIEIEAIKRFHGVPRSALPPPPRPNPLKQNRLKKLGVPKHSILLPRLTTPHNLWEGSLRKRFFSSPATLRRPALSRKSPDVVLPRLSGADLVPKINNISAKSTTSIPICKRIECADMSWGRTCVESTSTPTLNLKDEVECTGVESDAQYHASNTSYFSTSQANQGLLLPLCDLHIDQNSIWETSRLRKASFTVGHYTDHIKLVAIKVVQDSLRSCVQRIFARIHTDLQKRVALIQRIYRRHRLRLLAGVELNLLKLRRDEESLYWAEVNLQWERKALHNIQATSPMERDDDPAAHQGLQGLPYHKHTTCRHRPMSYDMNVYDYSTAGPFPESFLRKELQTALITNLRRSVTSSLISSSYTFVHSEARVGRGNKAVPSDLSLNSSKFSHYFFRLPIFLSHEIFVAIMDNMCFIIGEFRGDSSLFAHLKGRKRSIAEY